MVAEEGTYFTTVVAYNAAMQPSQPVCSSGVTVDHTPPWFEGVSLPGAVVRPGLVRNLDGVVWYVDSDRERLLVTDADSVCVSASALRTDLAAFPIRKRG